MENNLKELIRTKCMECNQHYYLYNTYRKMLETEMTFKDLGINVDKIADNAHRMSIKLTQFDELKLMLSQLCYTLGEEYIEIYEKILGDTDEC